ncbi:MAG: transcription termination/antitermination protein NusG [Pirellulaceae bacterium]
MPILARETSVFPHCLFDDSAYELGNSDRLWWAIFTRSRHEKALARELERFEIPFFLPLVAKQNRIRNCIVEAYVPLFTGYVFMFGRPDERVRALTTNRVSTMLPVPDQWQLCQDLGQLNRLIELDAPLTLERRLEAGRRVRIKYGPMKGLEGVVTHRRGGRRRLLIAVEFLQHGVSVEIDDYMVEAV